MDQVVVTRAFRVSQLLFIRTLAAGTGTAIVAAAALVAVVGIALSIIIDLRWLIVALMVILIMAPGLLALLYLYRGTEPVTALNRVLHSADISPVGIKIFIYDENCQEDKEDENDASTTDEEVVGNESAIMREVIIPLAEISHYNANSSAIILTLRTGGAIIILPYSAFDSEDSLRRAVQILAGPVG